ncbi:MAG: hypothetical protein KBS63_00035 [Clostridiales bacterium]|nr:hypothetical protein [Candidatus Crickella caballi]
MKPRTRMSREQRAKQFAPFKSVGGLDEILRRKEEEHRAGYEKVVHVSVEESEINAVSEEAENA